jgi:outer membrane protein assembly factor BamB
MDGNVQWERQFGEMTTRNAFGEGASPALEGNSLVIQWDHEGDSFIAAVDKRNGKELWRTPRDEPTTWATPLIVEDGKRKVVIAVGANRVRGYDLKSGEEIWACGGLGLNGVPVPVSDGNLVWVMTGWREAAGMAIRYRGAEGDITDSDRVVWTINDGLSYVPSPVLYDGRLYFLERFKGMLSSYELSTGKPIYTQQRIEEVGNIYASLVAAKGRIYLLDRNGNAVVFRHGDTFEVLARNKLDDGFDATPVLVDGELILRGHEHLYAIAAN